MVYKLIYNALKKAKAGAGDQVNGRHVVGLWAAEACVGLKSPHVLDVGAGLGVDLLAVREAAPSARLAAIESFPNSVQRLRAQGVTVTDVDLERQPLPFDDGSLDIVICNQVLEHLKEIFWLWSEFSRVMKAGGKAVIGVPNLGSLHNRVALLLGKQPPAIHVVGPHVRGITIDGFKEFAEQGGFFKVERVAGGGFYPFPDKIARLAARGLPGLAVSSFFLLRRTEKEGRYIEVLDGPRKIELVDTPYFRGAGDEMPRASFSM